MEQENTPLRGALALIERDPDYRILRHIERIPLDPSAGQPGWPTAVIVDTETTGRHVGLDGVIELGLLAFRFDPETGDVSAPIASYDGLREPGHPIPAEMTAIHGIRDEDVRGRALDLATAADILAGAEVAIAHKARFDRPFVETLGLEIDGLPWVCSMSEIAWQARGFDGTSLHPLLMQTGRFSGRHRAADDCRALHALLGTRLRDMTPPMMDLIGAARRIDVRLYAENAAYAHKETLKTRGYHWNDGADGRPKAWYKTFEGHAAADLEEAHLFDGLLRRNGHRLARDVIDATTRHRRSWPDG